MPKRNEDLVGGYAVCIVGRDDKSSIFKFKNSWGATDLIENPKALVKSMQVSYVYCP